MYITLYLYEVLLKKKKGERRELPRMPSEQYYILGKLSIYRLNSCNYCGNLKTI